MLTKYGDLNENSRSDDDPSKKVKSVEKDGFAALSKEAGWDSKFVPIQKLDDEQAARVRPGFKK